MSRSDTPDSPAISDAPPSRRQFLGRVGGATAGAIAIGTIGLEPLLGTMRSEAQAVQITPTSDSDRTEAAKAIRKKAADDEKALGVFPHPTNGDEELYPNRIGNFHKTLPHDSTTGEVDQAAYNQLLAALSTGNFADFEAIPRMTGATGRIANPLGGLAFNLEGPDSPAIPIGPIPPPIASAAAAAEVVELYWQVYLRDVPLADYNTNNQNSHAGLR
jgi:hypothetical protein